MHLGFDKWRGFNRLSCRLFCSIPSGFSRYQVELENIKDEYVRTLEESRKEKVFVSARSPRLALEMDGEGSSSKLLWS